MESRVYTKLRVDFFLKYEFFLQKLLLILKALVLNAVFSFAKVCLPGSVQETLVDRERETEDGHGHSPGLSTKQETAS